MACHIPKLIPFAKKRKLTRPDTLVKEDNTPSHASRFQQELVYNVHDISRLLWPNTLEELAEAVIVDTEQCKLNKDDRFLDPEGLLDIYTCLITF
jgi:hypothetical protein